jgi:hypothetical protein
MNKINRIRSILESDLNRKAWSKILAQSDWDYFITFSSNASQKLKKGQFQKTYNEWPVDRLRQALDHWGCSLDKKLLGQKWYKKTDQRTEFVAILEHPNSNPHWHLMLKLHCDKHQKFTDHAAKLWKKAIPSGTTSISLCHDQAALQKFSGYCSKSISFNNTADDIVFSKDFH